MFITIVKPHKKKSLLSGVPNSLRMKQYPSDLTDSQWQVIKSTIDNGRKRKYSIREIVNAILYITKAGCQRRMLPLNFPPWQNVCYYFRKWKGYGVIEELHDMLVEKVRALKNKKALPSVGIIDSQSAKAINVCQGNTGYDGGKKTKGRKRHIIVDTFGLLIAVVVQPANPHDSKGALGALLALKDKYLGARQKGICRWWLPWGHIKRLGNKQYRVSN